MIHRLIETTTPRSWAPGVCACGSQSEHDLPSYLGRQRWLRRHRLDVLMDETLGDVA